MKSKEEHDWLVRRIEGGDLSPTQILDLMMTQMLREVGAKKKGKAPVNCYALIISTFTQDGISDCIRCVSDHFPTVEEIKVYLVRSLFQGKPPTDSDGWWNPENTVESGDLGEHGCYSCEIKGPFASYALDMFTEDLGFETWPPAWSQIFSNLSDERLQAMITDADDEYR